MEISFYKHWIEKGRNYADGVAFYSIHGTNKTLKSLFATGDTKYTRQKLSEEIAKIPVLHKETGNRAKPKIIRDKLPPILQTEYDKLQGLIAKMSFKHAQLELVHTDDQRHALSKEILSLGDQRRSIFMRIDHYLANGKDLVQEAVVKKEPEGKNLLVLQLQDELRKLRSQRSKLKTNKKRVADYNAVLTSIADIERRLMDAN
ncbi:MAG: hypothetical protein V4608_03330 [Bacteroidota bacterium]